MKNEWLVIQFGITKGGGRTSYTYHHFIAESYEEAKNHLPTYQIDDDEYDFFNELDLIELRTVLNSPPNT